MGGKVWSYEEEQIFWTKIIPSSSKRAGIDRLEAEQTWNDLAELMKALMGSDARRKYTALCLFEHFFQNAVNKRPSPNAYKFVWHYLSEAEDNAAATNALVSAKPSHEKRLSKVSKAKKANKVTKILGGQAQSLTRPFPPSRRQQALPSGQSSLTEGNSPSSDTSTNGTASPSSSGSSDETSTGLSICSVAFMLNEGDVAIHEHRDEDGEAEMLFVESPNSVCNMA